MASRKKETGRLGPVSGASVEMRLHRSLAPLTQSIVRARFTSRGSTRASKGSKERGHKHNSKEQLVGQNQISCSGFNGFRKLQII